MSRDNFYVNDNYPLTTEVYADDGVTPALPLSAMIDILNQVTGDQVVTGGSCTVASGLSTYFILSGSTVAQTSGRYIGYMRVELDSDNARTIALPFDVLDKASVLPVIRWRAKVRDSSPDDDHISDDLGREWVDNAVDFLNNRYETGLTSVLGTIYPTPTTHEVEFITSVAGLMARYSWWAGRGTWRDSEMSFDGTPFQTEWDRLEQSILTNANDDWFASDMGGTMYNRDRVYYDGIKYDSPLYWERVESDPAPNTEIPI